MTFAQFVLVCVGLLLFGWSLPDAEAHAVPRSIIRDDTIEVIELNCYPSGRAFVFWDINGECCDWEFVRGEEVEPDGRGWRLTLWRGGKCYIVRSRAYVETTTAFDVEVMERQRVPENKRRRLGEYRSLNPFVAVSE